MGKVFDAFKHLLVEDDDEDKKEEKDKLILEVWLGSTTGEITFYSDAIEKVTRK